MIKKGGGNAQVENGTAALSDRKLENGGGGVGGGDLIRSLEPCVLLTARWIRRLITFPNRVWSTFPFSQLSFLFCTFSSSLKIYVLSLETL
jgi:hypothetical protein